jgi:hypothetical protein
MGVHVCPKPQSERIVRSVNTLVRPVTALRG